MLYIKLFQVGLYICNILKKYGLAPQTVGPKRISMPTNLGGGLTAMHMKLKSSVTTDKFRGSGLWEDYRQFILSKFWNGF